MSKTKATLPSSTNYALQFHTVTYNHQQFYHVERYRTDWPYESLRVYVCQI